MLAPRPRPTGVFARPRPAAPNPASTKPQRRAERRAEQRLPGNTAPVRVYPRLRNPTRRQAQAIVSGQRRALRGLSPAQRDRAAQVGDRQTRQQLGIAADAERSLIRYRRIQQGRAILQAQARDLSVSRRAPGSDLARLATTLELGGARRRRGEAATSLISRLTPGEIRRYAERADRRLAREERRSALQAGIAAERGRPLDTVRAKRDRRARVLGLATIDTGHLGRTIAARLNRGSGGFEPGGFLSNLGTDALHLPYDAVRSIAEYAQAGYDLAHGDTKRAGRVARGFAEGVIGHAVRGDWKGVVQILNDHPLYAALEVSGAYSAAGRLLGAGARGLRLPVGSTRRAALRVGPGRAGVVQRSYSKNLLTAAVQRSHDRALVRRGNVNARGEIIAPEGLALPKLGRRDPVTGERVNVTSGRHRAQRRAVDEFTSTLQDVGRTEREGTRAAALHASGARRSTREIRQAEHRARVVAAVERAGLAKRRRGESPDDFAARVGGAKLAELAQRAGVKLNPTRRDRLVRSVDALRQQLTVDRVLPTKIGVGRATLYLRPERDLLVAVAEGRLGKSAVGLHRALREEIGRLESAYQGSYRNMTLAMRRNNRRAVGAMVAMAKDLERGGKAGARAQARAERLFASAERYGRVARRISRELVRAGVLTQEQADAASLRPYAVGRLGLRYDHSRAPTDAAQAAFESGRARVDSARGRVAAAEQEVRKAREEWKRVSGASQVRRGQTRAAVVKPGEPLVERPGVRTIPTAEYGKLPKLYRGVDVALPEGVQGNLDRGAVARMGDGIAGRGIYASTERGVAEHVYARGKSDRVAEFALAPDAKVIEQQVLAKRLRSNETDADGARRLGYDAIVDPHDKSVVIVNPDAIVRPHGSAPSKPVSRAERVLAYIDAAEKHGPETLQRLARVEQQVSRATQAAEERLRRAELNRRIARRDLHDAMREAPGQPRQFVRGLVEGDPEALRAAQASAREAAARGRRAGREAKDVQKELGDAQKTLALMEQDARETAAMARGALAGGAPARPPKFSAEQLAAQRQHVADLQQRVQALEHAADEAARDLTHAQAAVEATIPRKVTLDEIRARYRDEFGVDAPLPAFVSHRPEASGSTAYFINWLSRGGRKSADTFTRTGESTRLGAHASGEAAAVDSLVHAQGVLSAARNWDRFIGAFGVTRPDGKPFTWREAEAFAEAKRNLVNAGIPSEDHLVPVRLAPARYGDARLNEILTGLQRPDAAEAPRGLLSDRIRAALEELQKPSPDGSARNVVLVSAQDLRRFNEHQGGTTSDLARFGQAWTNAFRSTVLPLSLKWLTGNVAEAMLRSALWGITPVDVAFGRRVLRELMQADEEAGKLFQARTQGGLMYGTASRLSVHRDAAMFADSGLSGPANLAGALRHAPLVGQVIDLYMGFAHAVFGLNKWLEQQFQAGVIGKTMRQEIQEARGWTSSWAQAVGLQRAAFGDAVLGLRNTPAQVRFARAIDTVLGKYSRFSPMTRRVIQNAAPFLPWYLNSVRFVYHTLPHHHPVKTALLVRTEATLDGDAAHAADSRPPGQLGAAVALPDGGLLDLSRYSPFGAFTPLGRGFEKPEALTEPLFPQWLTAFDLLRFGKDFTGRDVQLSSGDKPTGGQRLLLALYAGLETFAPAVQIIRRLQEHGATAYADSTVFSPRTKPDSAHPSPLDLPGLPAALNRVLNPARPVYLRAPSKGAALPREVRDALRDPTVREQIRQATRGLDPVQKAIVDQQLRDAGLAP